ncbi:acidic fibroblast growth factor intracellular-binding protein [Diabrotica virgifera virgifera]|uniref:Acidic fibroblast growth factor intracellular-binding protein n=1 Tax=Diabrotica virgifera virgifera TaxID=50390 RepID=A0ABM5ICS4_DIAVI|nr:acidic fibroblast growth factor intracellular-binding protein [Diabrotica virgifera virgifera]
MSEVDVFISNYTLVDPEIYELWVDGHTASEAVSMLNIKGLGQQTGASLELIASDVLDHYRTYSLLEKLLSFPSKLQEQFIFQIDPQTRLFLIEKYYEFDDEVVREVLGKKLSSKNRKDLDEVAEKTGKPLKSCRRQFDNVKRIFKTVEEQPGITTENIKSTFCLPEDLAKKYTCIVFTACMRFETSKKKVQQMSFNNFKICCEAMIENWTYHLTGTEYNDLEMDREFLFELRDLKVLMDKEREHKHLVLVHLKPKLLQKSYADLESNFKLYNRALLTLATTLHRSRDMKNFFVDLSQIVEYFKQSLWSSHDFEQFLIAYGQIAGDIDPLRTNSALKASWEKFLKVVTKCLLIMYS